MKWNHGQASVSCTAPISWIGSSHGCHKPYFATHTFLFNVTPGDLELPGRKHNNPQNQPIQITNQNYINRIHNITNKKIPQSFFSPFLSVQSFGANFSLTSNPQLQKKSRDVDSRKARMTPYKTPKRRYGCTCSKARRGRGFGAWEDGGSMTKLWNCETWKFLAAKKPSRATLKKLLGGDKDLEI